MAVNGFLKLLTNLKISNVAVLSQNSSGSFSSGHSLLTQISMSRASQTVGANVFSNEALCLELLSILKRCFMQQVEVRTQLYEGLYDAVCMNPELGIPVLDIIWDHFSEYYIIDEEISPPLNFRKITVIRELDSVLQEPLGKLVYAIGIIVTKVSESEEDRENISVVKFANIMDSICQRMSTCELLHFELDDGTDLLDILPESQHKVHVLKEAMNIYEALIGYKICSWNKDSENHGQVINSLFQGYSRLIHFSKTLAKPKKIDAKKKKNASKPTQDSQANNTTIKKNTQKSSRQFKVADTVLDFQSIQKVLSLLHEPTVDWTTPQQANIIKTKVEIHQHIMRATIHLIQSLKHRKDVETQYKKLYFNQLTDIAAILFTRIVGRLNAFIDFDCTTAVLAMECFHAILVLVNGQYKSNFSIFLEKVDSGENGDFIARLTKFVEMYQKIFEMDEDEVSNNPEIQKMSLIVINSLSLLINQIPSDSNTLSIQVYEWLKNFVYNNTVSSKVSSAFINVTFETHIKYKVSLTFLEQLSYSLGDTIGYIAEEDPTPENFKIIDEGTASNILLSICNNVKTILEDVDFVVARLKSEYYILAYPGVENVDKKKEHLQKKERDVCCHVCFVVKILTHLTNVAIQPGNMSEAIFKTVMMLFSSLCLITKHFIMRSSKANLSFQNARFETLVKQAGRQLAAAVYKFINYIESAQKPEPQPTQSKKKNIDSSSLKSKVLRETRLIPKVIYEMEQFSKVVIQLSNKTKVDLAKYVGQGTVRDFRIVDLKIVLNKSGENEPCTQSTQNEEEAMEEEMEEESIQENDDVEEEQEEDESLPPSKKSKR